jgi:hypothetical protein
MFFFHLIKLCSVRVGTLVIVLNNSQCEKKWKMEDLFDFEREHIVGDRLPGTSVTLLGASRETVSKVMSAYTNHRTTTSVKWNSGRNQH